MLYIEDILYNNYGRETSNNERKADHFIRIPITSLINKSLYRVPGIDRMVWVLKTGDDDDDDDDDTLDLTQVNAEISCVDCNRKGYFDCQDCDGDGNRIIYVGCDQCDNTGIFNYSECRDCDGEGTLDFICNGSRCQRGRIQKPCRQCQGIPGSEFYCGCCYGKG